MEEKPRESGMGCWALLVSEVHSLRLASRTGTSQRKGSHSACPGFRPIHSTMVGSHHPQCPAQSSERIWGLTRPGKGPGKMGYSFMGWILRLSLSHQAPWQTL